MLKKILFSSLAGLFLLFSASTPLYANGPLDIKDDIKMITYNRIQDPCGFLDVVCWIKNAMYGFADSLSSWLYGYSFSELDQAYIDPTGMTPLDGLAGVAVQGIGQAYENPFNLSLASYARYELSDNLLGERVFAQDSPGTQLLSGAVYATWSKVRNAAYAFLALITLFIGLMIMFGKEAAPRMTVTFTYALPRLVLAVILITFSLPLVALAYDVIAYGGSQVMIRILSADLPPGTMGDVGFASSIPIFGYAANKMLANTLAQILNYWGLITGSPNPDNGPIALLITALFGLFSVGLLFFVFFQLVFRQVRIMIAAILSPLALLVGALPGQEGMMGGLVKSIVADTAAFPAIALTFAISMTLVGSVFSFPPLGEGLAGGTTTNPVVQVAVIILLLGLIFKAPGMVERAIKGIRGH